MNENTETNRELLAKWLRVLFYAYIASIAVTIFGSLTGLDTLTDWVNKAITVTAIVALFQMAPANGRYRKAAIFKTAVLCCELISLLLSESFIFTLAAAVCALVATYQEYHGHSEIVADLDPKLSRNWENLFIWSIAVEILTVVAAMMALILVFFGDTLSIVISVVITVVLLIAAVAFEVVYLKYLNRMLHLVQD